MTPLHAEGRRAALLTLGVVGGVVLAATYVVAWRQDTLSVAGWNHSWPELTSAQLLGIAARWAFSVTLWCAVCWVAVVASGRTARRWILAGATGVVVGWTALGARTELAALDRGVWWYENIGLSPWWPGPVAPTYTVAADRTTGLEIVPDASVVGPGVLMPLVLLAAVVATCLVAARQPRWPVRARVSGRAWALATLALGIPALSIAALGLYSVISTTDIGTLSDTIRFALDDPGATLVVAMVTAALLVGRTPGGTPVAVAVGVTAVVPRAWSWFGGGGDQLLATAAAGAVAIAVAGCIGPAAAALTRLESSAAGEVADYRWPTSVPEGTDTDDRARA